MKQILYAGLFLLPVFTKAQNVGIGTASPQGLLHVDLQSSLTNGLLVTGTYNNSGSVPNLGAGTRLSFYPAKTSFRAGLVFGTEWDDANTGIFSMATGFNTIAKGQGSVALGQETNATGDFTFSTGYRTAATYIGSNSFGFNTRANGAYAFASGNFCIAKSVNEFVIGRFNDTLASTLPDPFIWDADEALFVIGNGTSASSRHNAFAVYKNGSLLVRNPVPVETYLIASVTPPPASGEGTRMMWLPEISAFRAGTLADIASTPSNEANYWNRDSIGGWSFAAGTNTLAKGNTSTCFGYNTVASGNYGTAMGAQTIAAPYASFAIGSRNDTLSYASKTSWVLTDPLFYIGNTAPGGSTRSNALVVYKNGNTDINGFTQLGEVAPAIKMKKLTVNTPASQGLFNFVVHGLTQSKILSISALATVSGGYQIIPNHEQAGYKYTLNVDNANIAIGTVAGNSGNILNAPVKILIVYEE